MPTIKPRVAAALKAWGVTELYLQDAPYDYYRVRVRYNGDAYRIPRGAVSQHYTAPGLNCWFTPSALGLSGPGLPLVWTPPADDKPAPAYAGLQAIRRDAPIYQIKDSEYWSNGHIAVRGPAPNTLAENTDGATVKTILAALDKCTTPAAPDLRTAYQIGGFLCYKVGDQYFQTVLVDFIIRNARKGVTITYMAGGPLLAVYGDLFLIGLLIAVRVDHEGVPQPHRPPTQGGILPWS